jgi:hypothetical protein
MKTKKNKKSVGKALAVGAGLAVASVGAYYFLGPKGKQHQRKAKDLLIKIKKEAQVNLKKVKSATKPVYDKSIDAITTAYKTQYKEHEGEINALAKKLKGEWSGAKTKTRSVVKKAKKTIKKAGK